MAPQVFYKIGCPSGKCEHGTHHFHHPSYDPAVLRDWWVHLHQVHGYTPQRAIAVARDMLNNVRPTSHVS